MKYNRIFLIVLDSFGIGNAPDAEKFDDVGADTLESISKSDKFNISNLKKLGLANIDCVNTVSYDTPVGKFGALQELSNGKDTTIGHFEIAGIISDKPMPTYPDGFPDEIIKPCNAWSKVMVSPAFNPTIVAPLSSISTFEDAVYTSSKFPYFKATRAVITFVRLAGSSLSCAPFAYKT